MNTLSLAAAMMAMAIAVEGLGGRNRCVDHLTMRHPDDDLRRIFPGPNKDVGYLGDAGPLEPRRGSSPRPANAPSVRAPRPHGWQKRLYTGGPLLWGGEPWPKRSPPAYDARVGDIIAGNAELRATCRCGHSKIIAAEALRSRHEPTEHLKRLRFVCTQCHNILEFGGGVVMRYTEEAG